MSGMSKKPTVSGDHTAFRKMEKRLEEVGGSLQDLVTMTVFILDVRHGLKFGGGGGGGGRFEAGVSPGVAPPAPGSP